MHAYNSSMLQNITHMCNAWHAHVHLAAGCCCLGSTVFCAKYSCACVYSHSLNMRTHLALICFGIARTQNIQNQQKNTRTPPPRRRRISARVGFAIRCRAPPLYATVLQTDILLREELKIITHITIMHTVSFFVAVRVCVCV